MKYFSLLVVVLFSKSFKTVFAVEPSQRVSQSFFIENKGQVVDQFGNSRADVKYIFQSHGFKMILRENEWSYEFSKINLIKNTRENNFPGEVRDPEFDRDDDLEFQANRTDVHLLNSNLHPVIIAQDASADVLNFYVGNNPMNGITQVQHFKKIIYQNVYPYIDLEIKIISEVYSKNLPIEYSFIVHPGGDPNNIQLEYDGNSSLLINENAVHLETSLGNVTESYPIYFIEGSEKKVRGAFLKTDNTISFSQTNYDHDKTFIIDPTITYSTYFGGDSTDYAEGIEIDNDGNIIVAGRTGSFSNIATSGAYDNTFGGNNYDMFMLKFNSSFQLQWATYFGGPGVDYGWSLALDAKNNIYLGGESTSDSLATENAEQKILDGTESDGVVTKFRSDGTLIWSRYFGGSEKDQVLGMCIDSTGRLIITGFTMSSDSISTAGAFNISYGGDGDIFLAALDTGNGNAIWSTYYGADKNDRGHHVAIDAHDNIYLSGTALSTTGIATAGTFHSTLAGSFDGFLAKFSQDGTPLWGTYLGGDLDDRGRDCTVDHAGNIYVTGFSQSDTGLATTGTWKQFRSPGIDSTGYGTLDAFIVKFDSNGHRFWGTYFGDTLSETSRGIAVNSQDDIFIAGATYSPQGIVYGNAYQFNLGGISDAYFAKFNPDGGLIYSSYFGGSGDERVGGYGLLIRTDDLDNFYLCSATQSEDSIATVGAYQTALAGGYDVFIAKFADTAIVTGESETPLFIAENHLDISPNPVHDFLLVKLIATQKCVAIIRVYSIEGKLMLRKEAINEGENAIQISENFESGLYLITVNDGNSVLRGKFIVE